MESVQDRTSNYESRGGDGRQQQVEEHLKPFDDFMDYLKNYARERPEVTIFTCLAIGFILGWKLKPW